MKSNWPEQRRKLKIEYEKRGITSCELKFEGCMKTFAMSFHHRHKRVWYIKRSDLLGHFQQTVLACAYCHDKAEASRKLTEEVFAKLRRKENEKT